jgi:hypothetical protein
MLTTFLISILLSLSLVSGCSPARTDGFGIYLIKNATSAYPLSAAPAPIEPESEPIIAENDVVSYDRQTHVIEVVPAAYERVQKLAVPVQGRPFAVCLGREIIYTGAFWTPISSMAFNGIVIIKTLTPGTALTIEPGYPTAEFFKQGDPRNNPRIMESLERAGKLK